MPIVKLDSTLFRDSMCQKMSVFFALLVMPTSFLGCGDNVRRPTAEQVAAFEAADPIVPAVDMERINKAKLQTGPYRVVPEDVLEFTMPALLHAVTEAEIEAARVQDSRDYPFICRVSREGTITLPAVGDLEVGGKSLGEIEASVARAYESYATKRPSVYARVLEHRTSKVYIAGVVEKPGVYTLRADQMTLVSLLTEAGGISEAGAALVRVLGSEVRQDAVEDAVTTVPEDASLRSTEKPSPRAQSRATSMTIRSSARGPSVHMTTSRQGRAGSQSEETSAPVAAADTTAFDGTQGPDEAAKYDTIVLPVVGMNIPFKDVALAEGDTVVVEPVQMPLISVLGLVRNPGNFEYPPYARYNLAQVIALAGGLQMDVDPRYATIYRLKRDGTVLRLTFKLIEDEQYTERLNVSVRPGDLVAVEQTPRTRTNAFVNRVVRLSVGTWVDLGDIWDDD